MAVDPIQTSELAANLTPVGRAIAAGFQDETGLYAPGSSQQRLSPPTSAQPQKRNRSDSSPKAVMKKKSRQTQIEDEIEED